MDQEEQILDIVEKGYTEEEISEVLSQIALTHMVFLIDEDGDASLISSRDITEDQAIVARRVALVLKDPSFILLSILFIEELLCILMDYITQLFKTRR